MAITNYAELQTAVANWLDRSDLNERIPEFIALGEAVIRRKLRTMGEEKRANADTLPGDATLSLPADFNGMRDVFIRGDPITPLSQVALSKLRSSQAGSSVGKPTMYAVTDDQLLLAPTPDAAYRVEMHYYAFSPLSDIVSSNAVLASHPDLYLHLSLAEGFRYMNDDQRELKMLTLAQKTIEDIMANDELVRFGASPLQVRIA